MRFIPRTFRRKYLILPVIVLGLGLYFKSVFNLQALEQKKISSPPEFVVHGNSDVGCKDLVDQYCSQLYSSKARGNLKISDGSRHFLTLQGQTKNNFDMAWFAYYKVRLERQDRIPKDLRQALLRRSFFQKLVSLLERPPKQEMEIERDIEFTDLEDAVDRAWDNSIEEVVLRRLENKYPKSHLYSDEETPQEVNLERWRIRYRLWSEISIALWEGHPRWKLVEQDFSRLKKAFYSAIKNLNIDEDLKADWISKIKKVVLTLPGQNPITANSYCTSTSKNAHYYPYLNTLTVCAGYFNGGEQIQTLAHELGHSLDFSSRLTDIQQASQFSSDLKALRKAVCSVEKLDCSQWAHFKSSFSDSLAPFESYQPEVPSFHSCLQKRLPTRKISEAVIQSKAKKIAKERFSDLTKNSSFFRLTSKDLPLPNGEIVENKGYLNPCSYHLWDSEAFPLDSELTTLLFFTASYRCESSTKENQLRAAIDVSKGMTESLLKVVLRNEGVFSSRDELQTESYSSPPTERFADRIGSYAVAEYLKQFKKISERRSAYLAASFWLCEKPSLRATNYEQYQSLSDLIVDRTVHADNEERLKDWLSPSVRDQLVCQFDFKYKECDL